MPPISFPTSPIEKLFQNKFDPVIRRQRDVDFDSIDLEPDIQWHRVKRDYYDDVHKKFSSDSSPFSTTPVVSEDYYGSVDESTPKRKELRSPLKNCVHILGIY